MTVQALPIHGTEAAQRDASMSAYDQLAASFVRTKVLHIELDQALAKLNLRGEYSRALCFVTLHDQPIGFVSVDVPLNGVTAASLAAAIWRELGQAIESHLSDDGLPAAGKLTARGLSAEAPRCREQDLRTISAPPLVSVIIPTRDRAADLHSCLDALARVNYPAFEVIVVDNASRTSATREAVLAHDGGLDLRYAREDRPGISHARNHGLSLAKGEITACIDDDVRPAAGWLLGIARGFEQSQKVAAVTGLIVPRELETPAQSLFEGFARFGKGMHSRTFDMGQQRPDDPLFPYALGAVGTGANFAFRTEILRSLGGFDPSLGVGSPAHGGEDLEVLFRVLSSGYQIRYEPRATVYHAHPADYRGLERRTYLYGVGLMAYLTKVLADDPRRVADVAGRLPRAIRHVVDPKSAKNATRGAGYPTSLVKAELRGMLYGPLAYLKSRRSLAVAA